MFAALTYVANIAARSSACTMADRWGARRPSSPGPGVSLALSFSIGWLIALPLGLRVALACLYNFAGIADSSTHSLVLAEERARALPRRGVRGPLGDRLRAGVVSPVCSAGRSTLPAAREPAPTASPGHRLVDARRGRALRTARDMAPAQIPLPCSGMHKKKLALARSPHAWRAAPSRRRLRGHGRNAGRIQARRGKAHRRGERRDLFGTAARSDEIDRRRGDHHRQRRSTARGLGASHHVIRSSSSARCKVSSRPHLRRARRRR